MLHLASELRPSQFVETIHRLAVGCGCDNLEAQERSRVPVSSRILTLRASKKTTGLVASSGLFLRLAHLVEDSIGDSADQIRRDIDRIELA